MTQSIEATKEATKTEGGFAPVGGNQFETLVFEINQDGIARITLNRPDSLNALTIDMGNEIKNVLKIFSANPQMRVLILTGAGRGFCAGADLKSSGSGAGRGEPGSTLRDGYNPMVLGMTAIEKPIIAAVNGVAAGAGFSLALACDMRIASEKARFISAFARIGLVPDCGLSYFLPRLIGVGRAMEITTMGGEVTAAEALAWGMVNRVVPAEDFERATLEFATRLAKGPTRAIGLTKKLVQSSLESELASLLDAEASTQALAGKTTDFREGVTAFIEKRPAQFKGE